MRYRASGTFFCSFEVDTRNVKFNCEVTLETVP